MLLPLLVKATNRFSPSWDKRIIAMITAAIQNLDEMEKEDKRV